MAALALLAAPVASFAQNGHWTSVGSAGATIDEADQGIYAVDGGDLFFAANTSGTLNARYNVVNTANINLEMPVWNTLEIGYTDTGAGAVQAFLWRVDPCTGNKVLLCSVTSTDNPNAVCKTCNFAGGLNFVQNLYFVGVQMIKNAQGPNPILHTLRIF